MLPMKEALGVVSNCPNTVKTGVQVEARVAFPEINGYCELLKRRQRQI